LEFLAYDGRYFLIGVGVQEGLLAHGQNTQNGEEEGFVSIAHFQPPLVSLGSTFTGQTGTLPCGGKPAYPRHGPP
jgi:hypothetical protein